MDPIEVFTKRHLKKEMIFTVEVIDLGEKYSTKHWKIGMETGRSRLYNYCGIMIPSLDAYLINKLNYAKISYDSCNWNGMCCRYSGIIYAKNFLQSKRAAVIAVESPTATFQLIFDVQYCKAAIFGDGAACFTFFSRRRWRSRIFGRNVSFYENEHMMGFKLTNTGLQMILDIEVQIR
jgi:predicted naringenin-chalcone synthase